MSACLNCGSSLGCSCQKRIASDGKSVCANCITAYEVNLKKKTQTPLKPDSTTPTNVNVSYNAPK